MYSRNLFAEKMSPDNHLKGKAHIRDGFYLMKLMRKLNI